MISFLFFILNFITLILGVELLVSKSLLRKTVSLIGLFLCVGLAILFVGEEFFALVYIIVYVGAIAVLFLFVVMLVADSYPALKTHQPLLETISFILLFLSYFVLSYFVFITPGESYLFSGHLGNSQIAVFYSFNQMQHLKIGQGDSSVLLLAQNLWGNGLVWVFLAMFILFVGLISVVALTRGKVISKVRKQSSFTWKGALTNKPYSFKFRPWELSGMLSYDGFDSFLHPIEIETKGAIITRIIPADNSSFPWISDKARFFFDGLVYQRLTNPLINLNSKGLYKVTLSEALLVVSRKIRHFMSFQFGILKLRSRGSVFFSRISDFSDLFAGNSVKNFFGYLGGGELCLGLEKKVFNFNGVNFLHFLPDFTSKDVIEQPGHSVLLAGVDLRFELPRLNIIFRYFLSCGKLRLYGVGLRLLGFLKYNIKQLGLTSATLFKLFSGRHFLFPFLMKNDNNFNLSIFWGRGFLNWSDGLKQIAKSAMRCQLVYGLKNFFLFTKPTSLSAWFLGGLANKKVLFTTRLRSLKKNLTINSDYFSEIITKPVTDFSFNSFFSSLLIGSKNGTVSLPTLTIEEQTLNYVDLTGVMKLVMAVSGFSKILEQSSGHFSVSEMRTLRDFLSFLGKNYGFRGFLTKDFFLLSLKQFVEKKFKFTNYKTSVILSYLNLKLKNFVKKAVSNWFVSDFFQTECVTKNSNLLRSASFQFYTNVNFYF